MNIKRRHLLQNSIGALIGFELTRLGIKSANSQELPTASTRSDLKQGRFGLIPPQLSQRFFESVISTDRVIKERYDSFVAKGFKFATDSLVGANVTDANSKSLLITTLIGKKVVESQGIAEYAVISTIFTNKTLFDLGTSSTAYSVKSSQLQALTLYLPGTEKLVEIQLDRQSIIEGTSADLAARISGTIEQIYANKNMSKDPQQPSNVVATGGSGSLSEAKSLAALDSLRQQIGREEFLTVTKDRDLHQKLTLAIQNLNLNRSKQTTGSRKSEVTTTLATLPLVIELALAANLIGNAKRLDSDPVIMPRQSEIPEPSYR